MSARGGSKCTCKRMPNTAARVTSKMCHMMEVCSDCQLRPLQYKLCDTCPYIYFVRSLFDCYTAQQSFYAAVAGFGSPAHAPLHSTDDSGLLLRATGACGDALPGVFAEEWEGFTRRGSASTRRTDCAHVGALARSAARRSTRWWSKIVPSYRPSSSSVAQAMRSAG